MTKIMFTLTETDLTNFTKSGATIAADDNCAVISISKTAYKEVLKQLIYAEMGNNIETITVQVQKQ